MFCSRKQPVPYVFFDMPGVRHICPKSAACWSPAMPATGTDRSRAMSIPGRTLRSRTVPPAGGSRDVEQPQQLVVPLQRVDVEQHGARRVAHVGHVTRAAGQLPHQPRVDGPERQLARFGARPRARHVVQQPPDLARREIGVDEQTGPRLNRLARALRFEPLAEVRRPAVLPDDGVVNRFAGLAIPDDGRFALVRDADGGDVLGAHLGPPSASTATPICDAQISCGSCSTHPGAGNICVNSFGPSRESRRHDRRRWRVSWSFPGRAQECMTRA